ncbi:MAG: ParB N-terminal domain-containing protein [Chloroflexi bacterium]|nr:ParB N-terminal domain-containing protein [Chloroflexota bacterium]
MTKRRSKGTRALLEEMGDLGGFAETMTEITGAGLKVVDIVLDRIRPDPAQPRRVLPQSIRQEFLAGHINARQALERWEAQVAEEATRNGRPRPDWKALLERNPEDRSDDTGVDAPGIAGPEEELLRAIVSTAATIRYGGQVSPITVSEIESGNYYRIETGERRYWAHHWLNTWLSEGFDQIQCIVVERASPWRQAAENTSRERLSAMAMARQLATLLLDLHDIQPDYAQAIPNDWYRQALQHRVPRGEGERLRAALGGISRSQFSRIQALLELPDAVWELADRHRVEEKRLRYLLKIQDDALQLQAMKAIVASDLSAERIQQIVERGEFDEFVEGASSGVPVSRRPAGPDRLVNNWSRLVRDVPKTDLDQVVDQWLLDEKPDDIRKQLSTLRKLLDLVEKRIERD